MIPTPGAPAPGREIVPAWLLEIGSQFLAVVPLERPHGPRRRRAEGQRYPLSSLTGLGGRGTDGRAAPRRRAREDVPGWCPANRTALWRWRGRRTARGTR